MTTKYLCDDKNKISDINNLQWRKSAGAHIFNLKRSKYVDLVFLTILSVKKDDWNVSYNNKFRG